MKILLFGKNGQVGWELNRSLQLLGEVIALGRDDADFSKPEMLRDIIRDIKPDVIVNAVAYTSVDKAEEEEDLAYIINAESPKVLAEEAVKIKALLVHYSTDYIFDGAKSGFYVEEDKPNPVNAYGRTKLAGEVSIISTGCTYIIFRTSWVYSATGSNFLLTILKLAEEKGALSVVNDQIGSPTPARLIAEVTLLCLHQAIIKVKKGDFISGMYNLTASNNISWYGFASLAINLTNKKLSIMKKNASISEIATEEYQTTARRPLNSSLSLDKIQSEFNIVLPSWDTALNLFIEDMCFGK